MANLTGVCDRWIALAEERGERDELFQMRALGAPGARLLPGRAAAGNPAKPVCRPLRYGGNPEVNGVSHRGAGAATVVETRAARFPLGEQWFGAIPLRYRLFTPGLPL